MTSLPSWEELEDALRAAGIRDRMALARLKIVINRYAVAQARNLSAGQLPPARDDVDLEEQILCPQCGVLKFAYVSYYRRSDRPAYRMPCKGCMKKNREKKRR